MNCLTSLLLCLPKLVLHVGKFSLLRDQLIDNLVNAVRDQRAAGKRLVICFGKVDLIAMNSFISSESGYFEDLQTAIRDVEGLQPVSKPTFSTGIEVINQTFGRASKQRACCPWRSRLYGLGLIEDLFYFCRHFRVRKDAAAVGPNHFFANEQDEFAACNATAKAKLFRFIELCEVHQTNGSSADRGVRVEVRNPLARKNSLQNQMRVRNHRGSAIRTFN